MKNEKKIWDSLFYPVLVLQKKIEKNKNTEKIRDSLFYPVLVLNKWWNTFF